MTANEIEIATADKIIIKHGFKDFPEMDLYIWQPSLRKYRRIKMGQPTVDLSQQIIAEMICRLCPSEHPVKIIFDEHTDDDKIVITNDGKTTTATLYSNGKKAGVGTAVCHDDDKFDIYTGAKLALERLERYKKEAEMSDWEKFIKGEVDMRVPKKYLQNFLCRTKKDGLEFKGLMPDWYLRWLTQDGDSIVVSVEYKIDKIPILAEVLCNNSGMTVDYIPGMK